MFKLSAVSKEEWQLAGLSPAGTWFSSKRFCSLIPNTNTFWGDGGRSSSKTVGTLVCLLLIVFAFRQSFYFGGILLPSQNHQLGGRPGSSLGTDLQISPLSWDQSSNSVGSECVTRTSITLISQCEMCVREHRGTDGQECSSSVPKAV